jgi:RND family efflux transporter MFP subunit
MQKSGIIIIIILFFFTACNPSEKQENTSGKEAYGQANESSDKNARSKVAVEVLEVKPEDFRHYIEVNGTVQAEEEAIVSPEVGGQIKKIYIKEGQEVKKGRLLVILNTSLIESNIREVKTSLKLAKLTYQKQEQLWNEKIGTEMQYLQAKNNKETLENKLHTLQTQLEMAKIKAPFDGIVDEIFVKTGEQAAPGMKILHIVNISKLKIYADVSERYLSSVHTGDIAEISFPAFQGYTMEEKIFRTGKVINEKSRTFRIELKIENKDKELLPNLISKIKLNDFSTENALVVPSHLIKQDVKGSYLFIVETQDGKEKVKKVYINTGITYEDKTMITKGLSSGDRVIVSGYNLVTNGTEVAIRA